MAQMSTTSCQRRSILEDVAVIVSMMTPFICYFFLYLRSTITADCLERTEGSKHTFKASWASRFYKRHNIPSRVCTTKMRELFEDFDAKRAHYVTIGSELIACYDIFITMLSFSRMEANLIYNFDE